MLDRLHRRYSGFQGSPLRDAFRAQQLRVCHDVSVAVLRFDHESEPEPSMLILDREPDPDLADVPL